MKKLLIMSLLWGVVALECGEKQSDQGFPFLQPQRSLGIIGNRSQPISTRELINREKEALNPGLLMMASQCEDHLFSTMTSVIEAVDLDEENYIQKCKELLQNGKLFFDTLFKEKPVNPATVKNSIGNDLLQILWITAASVYIGLKGRGIDKSKYELFVKYYLIPMSRYLLEKGIVRIGKDNISNLTFYELKDLDIEGQDLVDLLIKSSYYTLPEVLAKCEGRLSDTLQKVITAAKKGEEGFKDECAKAQEDDEKFFTNLFQEEDVDPATIKNKDGTDLLQIVLRLALPIKTMVKEGLWTDSLYTIFEDNYLIPMSRYFLKKEISILDTDSTGNTALYDFQNIGIKEEQVREGLREVEATNLKIQENVNLLQNMSQFFFKWEALPQIIMTLWLLPETRKKQFGIAALFKKTLSSLAKDSLTSILPHDVKYISFCLKLLFNIVEKEFEKHQSPQELEQKKQYIASLLYIAALCGNNQLVTLALANGANVNMPFPWHLAYRPTALELAAYGGHYDTVELLLVQGADITIKDQEGNKIIKAAISTDNVNFIEFLIAKGAIIKDDIQELFLYAIYCKAINVMKFLLTQGANVNLPDRNEWTPLCIFIAQAQWKNPLTQEIIDVLLKEGADINKGSSEGGSTPLIRAIKEGQFGLVKYLLENGANPLLQDDSRQTPMDVVKWQLYTSTTEEGKANIERIKKLLESFILDYEIG